MKKNFATLFYILFQFVLCKFTKQCKTMKIRKKDAFASSSLYLDDDDFPCSSSGNAPGYHQQYNQAG